MATLSCFGLTQLFATLWTATLQAALSMGFSRQEHWSGLPFPSPGDFPNPGIKLKSLASPALSGRFFRDKKENHTYLWKRTHSFCQAVICALVWSGLCHSII